MKSGALSKVHYVFERLAEGIQGGRNAPGGRMPSDRDIAAEYGVSYMTARRAVGMLAQRGLVERRPPHGTYVRQAASAGRDGTIERRLTVICPAYQAPDMEHFIALGRHHAQQRNLRLRVVRVMEGQEHSAIQAVESPGMVLAWMHEYYGWKDLERALVLAADRTALIGHRMDDRGVLSIMGHDEVAMDKAVELLWQAGHRRIAYVMHHPNLAHARERLATWRSALRSREGADRDLDRDLIAVPIPVFRSQSESAHTTVRDYIDREGTPASAMICVNDEIALGAMAACRDAGIRVPEDMSFVTLANSDVARFVDPPLTSVSIDIKAEVDLAMELLLRRVSGRLAFWDTLHWVAPVTIQRQSVRSLTS